MPPTVRFDRGQLGFAALVARPLGLALSMAAPTVVCVAVAVTSRVALAIVGFGGVAATMLVITASQVVGMALARGIGHPAWAKVWFVHALLAGVLIPLLGLQAVLGSVPFTDLALESGGPFLATSVVLVACLVVLIGIVAALCRTEPEIAAVVFLPVAMTVPALLGLGADTVSSGIVGSVTLSLVIVAAVVFLTMLGPRGMWLVLPQAALVLQLVGFLATGSGPRTLETVGWVVPAGYGAVLATTVVGSVCVPLLARWLARQAGDVPSSVGRR